MVENRAISITAPQFSIIVVVYNDWVALDLCLRSVAQQKDGPTFEVIVVDDGSSDAAPGIVAFRFLKVRYCYLWTQTPELKKIASQPLLQPSQSRHSTIIFNCTLSEIAPSE